MRRIWGIANNLSIRQKWFYSFFLLTVLPLSLFIAVNYFKTSEAMKQKLLFSARQALDQSVSFLDYRTSYIVNISDVIVSDSRVQTIASRTATYYMQNRTAEVTDFHYMYDLFSNLQAKNDVARIRLFLDNGASYTEGNANFLSLRNVQGKLWFTTLFTESRKVSWFPGHYFEPHSGLQDTYISSIRRLPDLNDLSKTVGVLSIDIKESILRDLLNKTKITQETLVMLINNRSEIISSSENPTDWMSEFAHSELYKLTVSGNNAQDMLPIILNHEKYYSYTHMVENTDWKMLLLLPNRDIIHETAQARNELILFFGIFTFLAFLMALYISSSHTKRIRRLIVAMKQVETGNFNTTLPIGSYDEIGVLTNKFNFLTSKINALLDEKYQMGLNAKSAELKALQSQINPHFLYNTLDLINHFSIQSRNPQITKIVMTLAKYYKISLSHGEDWVTLQSELDHVQAYVDIQNSRFENGVQLEIHIPPELLNCKLPKITLQPLVENAIIHGILEKDIPKGTIRITGRMERGFSIIAIQDDGVGMPAERLSSILNTEDAAVAKSGYGVQNIHERLQLCFGPLCGLTYESEPGTGTTVYLKLYTAGA
ncbi:sensor histidine kinase [Paenibacillus koleovorans]|uniref:sensor histidine kinase n=1 Tax=Paenibacillus koleovorans TaxID=121608 RepID=UPI000FD9FE38|nr:sensor histidine kinase [Paenibacillus koleovorans]